MPFAFALIGFTSLISQVILLRELLVVFYGSELAVGVILAGWLWWVAVGAWGWGKFKILNSKFKIQNHPTIQPPNHPIIQPPNHLTANSQLPLTPFAILQLLTFIILPLELYLARNIRNFVDTVPGEVIGFFPMLVWSFITLAPICAMLGTQFVAACDAGRARFSAGQVYLYESLGAVVGGLLVYFVFLSTFSAWQIALGLGVMNVLVAVVQIRQLTLRVHQHEREADLRRLEPANYSPRSEAERGAGFALLLPRHLPLRAVQGFRSPVVILAVVTALTFQPAAAFLQDVTLRQRWQGFELVESVDSIYGNLAVTAREKQFTFFENGLLLATTEDYLIAEETAHLTLLQHAAPKRVLLIGGGVNGTLRELLKHPVERVDYAELDPTVIATAKRYLAPADRAAFDDARVAIHHVDGRLFVQQQRARGEKYDVVLMNVPHPFTAQINRLYTAEFFRQVRDVLRDDGIFAFPLISSENRPSRETQALDASIYRTLRDAFADALVLPGEDALLLASPKSGTLITDYQLLLTRWTQRQLQTAILTPSHVEQRMTPERIAYAQRVFDRDAPLNRDLEPISLYLDLTMWAGYFSPQLRDAMNALLSLRSFTFYVLLLVLSIIAALFLRAQRRIPLSRISSSIAAIGFAGMVWEVILIFAFQIFYGYVYHQIALLMTAFMIGLVAGSGWANRVKANHHRALAMINGAAVVYSLGLPLALWGLQSAGEPGIMGVGVIALLVVAGAVLVGAAYPLAASPLSPHPPSPSPDVRQERGKGAQGVGGEVYAADLLGAVIGALIIGAILVPILGVTASALLTALVNLFGFLEVKRANNSIVQNHG